MKQGIAILGIFVADLAFRAGRQPVMGETLMGSGFAMGPGGKGSNQAVAAARAGGRVSFISRLGQDAFGDIAIATWKPPGMKAGRYLIFGGIGSVRAPADMWVTPSVARASRSEAGSRVESTMPTVGKQIRNAAINCSKAASGKNKSGSAVY